MKFHILDRYPNNLIAYKNSFILIKDNWDDWFQFETKHYMYYIDETGTEVHIGAVKIGQKDMQKDQRSANIPSVFEELPSDCFSLGQSDYYYEALNQYDDNFRIEVLKAMHDIAYDLELYSKVKSINVTHISLMREVSKFTLRQQFHRIAQGSARLTKYEIEYTYPSQGDQEPPTLTFSVIPESNPPTNIHVIIGRNNVGKTFLIKNLIRSIYIPEECDKYGRLRSSNASTGRLVNAKTQAFANVLCVSFSPFDNYTDITKIAKKKTMPFTYIGLSADNLYETLNKKFVESIKNCLFSDRKIKLLDNALTILETDPIFERSNLRSLLNINKEQKQQSIKENLENARKLFSKLSSGHQVIMLTLSQLIENITERSLVILDEPENHLHPLLAAFIRALSELLIDRNAVALIATHSPVILQEVPKKCIWKLNRSGSNVSVSRLEIESFGATIGSLTREVFGLEVRRSGFHKMLIDMVNLGKSYDEIMLTFNLELGDEAKSLLRTLIMLRDDENETLEQT